MGKYKTYFSLYDPIAGRYLATGRNCDSKEEVKLELLNYLAHFHDEDEMVSFRKLDADQLAQRCELEIEELEDLIEGNE